MQTPAISFMRDRFPSQIIAHAVWLYLRFNLSLREVEEMQLERGIGISYEAVRRWIAKFGARIAGNLRRKQVRPGDVWYHDDVACAHGVARSHIVKIVYELGRAGYLETLRGLGGGFRLGRPAKDIAIGDVVRLTEGPLDWAECFNAERNTCPLIGICKLSRALQTATKAFMAVHDDLTRADIVSNRGELLARIAPIEEGIVVPMRRTQ